MEEDKKQETTEVRSEKLLLWYGELFAELMQSERFRNFLNTNFDILKEVDDETNQITVAVVEVPTEVVGERIRKLMEDSEGGRREGEGVGEDTNPRPKKIGKSTIIKHPNSPAAKLADKMMKKLDKKREKK